MIKVLLCDAAFSSVPLLRSLKANGFYVGVCGSREDDVCHHLADKSHLIDYSNSKELKKIFLNESYDYLVPGCTDTSYLSASRVANDLNLPGYEKYEVSKIIHDKLKFRDLLSKNNIPSPKYTKNIKDVNKLRFPILAKPINLYIGLGIQKFNSIEGFNDASLERNLKYVFEEFIEGALYSHSAFIKNGQIAIDFFVKEFCTVYPYQVNSSHMAYDLNPNLIDHIRLSIMKVLKILNINEGVMHTQFIMKNNQFWLVESCRRCPGDLYSELIHLATGIEYSNIFISSFCELEPIQDKFPLMERNVARHTLSSLVDCIFQSSSVYQEAKKIKVISLKKVGDILLAAPKDRAQIFFVEFFNRSLMEKETKDLYKKIVLTQI